MVGRGHRPGLEATSVKAKSNGNLRYSLGLYRKENFTFIEPDSVLSVLQSVFYIILTISL